MNKNIKNHTVTNNTTVNEALTGLNLSQGLVFLTDSKNKFIRTITDGDIRRFLINGGKLESKLKSLGLTESITGTLDTTPQDALAIMTENKITGLPILNREGEFIDCYRVKDLNSRVLLSYPHIGSLEQQYVQEAFESNWIAPLGPNVDNFEKELCEEVSVSAAAALSSGTAAIHLALVLLGVKAGDRVLCSSFTFVASANPILYQQAEPIFVDSERETWNMCPEALRKALESEPIKPKAIIVVHLYGQSAKMDEIMTIAKEYDIPVIEDAAESLGGTYKGRQTGTIGDFGIYSFNGNKIITTSGGGMLVSNNKELIAKARFLSTQAKDNAPYYEHTQLGFNYRMSNVLAGIGRGQLQVLKDRVASRREVFQHYYESLSEVQAIDWMPELDNTFSNRWLSTCTINPDLTDMKPKELMKELEKENIESRHLWKPMHLQPLFENCKFYSMEEKPYSEYLFEYGLCLPSNSSMSEDEQNRVIEILKKLLT